MAFAGHFLENWIFYMQTHIFLLVKMDSNPTFLDPSFFSIYFQYIIFKFFSSMSIILKD